MVVPIALANATLRISASDNKPMFSTLAILPPGLKLGETRCLGTRSCRRSVISLASSRRRRRETEDLPRLRGRGGPPIEARTVVDDLLHQVSVARREPGGWCARGVLEPGPALLSRGLA